MINLTVFLNACGIPLKLDNFKIHLATENKGKKDVVKPLDAFFAGDFKEWQESQTRKNFTKDMVIGLIEVSTNKWIFAGVYKVLGCSEKSPKHFIYQTELLPNQDDLIGRVIVEHVRKGRASYLIGKGDSGDFIISELKENKQSVQEFPGFDSVCISFSRMKTIITQEIKSWRGALSNIKGIYLITDSKTGKLYVGSATGESGIWQRWSEYAHSIHGGNVDLKGALKKSGDPKYHFGFNYSILQIADSNTSDAEILERESYWKKILLSREHGYNLN